MASKWGQSFRLTPSLPTRPEATGILRTALDHPADLVLRYRAIREGAPEILQIARRRWQNTETVLSPTARTVSGALSRMMGLLTLSAVRVGHHGFEGSAWLGSARPSSAQLGSARCSAQLGVRLSSARSAWLGSAQLSSGSIFLCCRGSLVPLLQTRTRVSQGACAKSLVR